VGLVVLIVTARAEVPLRWGIDAMWRRSSTAAMGVRRSVMARPRDGRELRSVNISVVRQTDPNIERKPQVHERLSSTCNRCAFNSSYPSTSGRRGHIAAE